MASSEFLAYFGRWSSDPLVMTAISMPAPFLTAGINFPI